MDSKRHRTRKSRLSAKTRPNPKRQRREKRPLLLIVPVAAVLMLSIGLLALFLQGNAMEASDLPGNETDDTIEVIDDENAVEVAMQPALEPYARYYFFREERSQRYLDYQAAHPDMTPERVVIHVNIDLDTPAYEDVQQADDPDSLGVFVTKHYSLPYDYEPPDLVEYGLITIRSVVVGPLEQLVADASADGIDLTPSSGYRSASTQEYIYQGFVDQMGVETADTQSARAGHSEHQTGWAIDFAPADYTFYNSPQALWLEENAYRYGFIVRYADENSDETLYIHEPWHIRYVGPEVSNFMRTNSIGSFEEYWVKFVQCMPESSG